ncbi:MAG: MFS transporter [Dehalococcoidia bacterium]|nr:MFS transporter [Dehalococcoidia bacterium]
MAVETSPPAGAADAASEPGRRRRPKIYYGYYLVGAAFFAQMISAGAQTYVAGVFLVPMTEEMDWTRSDFTLAQTVGRFFTAFLGIFLGSLVDRGYARRLMFLGATIIGAAVFATSFVTDLWQYILLRGVILVMGAAMVGNLVVNVTLSKWWVEKRGRMVGFSSMGVSAAGVFLPLVLTPIVDEFGWRAGWRVLAVIAWALLYPAAAVMRGTPEEQGLNPDGRTDEEMASPAGDRVRADFANSLTRGEALRTPAFYLIVLAFGISGVGLGTMLFTTIPFTTDAGFSRTFASLMLSLFVALPAALVKPIWGWGMDRVSPKVLAASSFVIAAIGSVIIVFAAQAGAGVILALGFILVGAGLGGQIPIQEVIWGSYFGRRYLGSVRSVAMPFALFFGAGGPQAVQIYYDKVGDYYGAFLAVGALWLLAAGFVLLVKRPDLPQRILDERAAAAAR